MAKINNREIYKNIDFPSLFDFLLGTKADDGKTKSFPLQSIIQLINGVNGVNNIQYKFSDLSVPSDPEIDYLTPGYFFTNNNNTEVGTFTQLIFNKETLYPIDLTQLFNKLGTLEDVVIKLENPSDPNNFFNFKVVSFTANTHYFTFGVQGFNDLYLGEFVNEQIYSLYFDINSSTSNFNIAGTTTDAGNNKDAAIERNGTVGVGIATATNHAMRKDQVETADAAVLSSANSYTDAGLATKLDTSAYNDRWKGKHTSLSNLELAHPTANAGDYAQVDEGAGFDVINYNYDLEDGWIEGGSGSAATNTDMLPEGSTNLYFTVARVLATILTGISFATGGAILSTDSVLVAFGKLQKQINDLSTIYQSILTDVNFGAFINGLTGKTTPIDADSISIVDSADSNKQKKVSLTNFKAYLLTFFDTKYAVPQIIITTSTSITTATTDGSGYGQKGRNVIIDNGTNAINLTVNGGTGFTSSYIKHGTGVITFVQGSGRTLIKVDGTLLFNGAVGSVAIISSVGTTDYLRIYNA